MAKSLASRGSQLKRALIRDVTGGNQLIQAQEKPVLLRPFWRREVCSLLGDESGQVLLLIAGMENLSFPLCLV